jgi:hypothetical protein
VFSRSKLPDRDRNRLKRIEPLWTANGLTPVTACPHRAYLGEEVVCPVCHRTGLDGHPLLKRDARTDPKPEPVAPPAPPKKPLTRREKRKLLAAFKKATVNPKYMKVSA